MAVEQARDGTIIEELRALLGEATPGLWEGDHDGYEKLNNVSEFIRAPGDNDPVLVAYGQMTRADRCLIVALVNAAPRLLALASREYIESEKMQRFRHALQDIADAQPIPNNAVAFVWCRDLAKETLRS